MIVGFSGFGFPKAHGAAFGLLAYQSTWLRVHYGPEFLCALLDEQPMGFYPPDALVHEAQRRGIELLAPDVNASRGRSARSTARRAPSASGLGYVLGVRARRGRRARRRARGGRPVPLARRPRLARGRGAAVARRSSPGRARATRWPLRRRRRRAAVRGATALWQLGVAAPGARACDGGHAARAAARPAGRAGAAARSRAWDAMVADYATTGLTLGAAPARAAARRRCRAGRGHERATSSARATARAVRIGGLVVARQRPGTAKGIVFLLLEDEFGTINLIVPPPVYERHRLAVRTEPLLLVARAAREARRSAGGAINVFVRRICGRSTRPGAAVAEVVELRRATSATAELAGGASGGGRRRRVGRLPRRRAARCRASPPGTAERMIVADAPAQTGKLPRPMVVARSSSLLFVLSRSASFFVAMRRWPERRARERRRRRRARAASARSLAVRRSRSLAARHRGPGRVIATDKDRDSIPEANVERPHRRAGATAASCSAESCAQLPHAARRRTRSARSGRTSTSCARPKALVLDAIEKGRAAGNGNMPAELVEGEDAEDVAAVRRRAPVGGEVDSRAASSRRSAFTPLSPRVPSRARLRFRRSVRKDVVRVGTRRPVSVGRSL